MKFQFSIDRGGTFTDVFVRTFEENVDGDRKTVSTNTRVLKLLSEDPANYPDAPREAIRRVLEEELGVKIPGSMPVPTEAVDWIRMGTTVATNALLERQGERMSLVITKGFSDLLFIGNQSRPRIFDLSIQTPEMLYESVVEVEERVVLRQESCRLEGHKSARKAMGVTGEEVEIWREVDEERLRRDLESLLAKGVRSLAVVLLHSFIYPEHERRVGAMATEMGFNHVSLSHQVMPMARCVPRGFTTCADAYLTPCIRKYVDGFKRGFEGGFVGRKLLFMKSDGGLTPMENFNGSRAILSGPAGGVVGYAMTAYSEEERDASGQPSAVIGFDMGGTSTDVSRFDGEFEHTFETVTAGVAIQAPQLDINTVAAGGGSRLFYRAGLFVVGPESAGAHPGPVCYRKGGSLTVTDANLVLGRLLPDFFPKIFGPNQDQPLDKDGSVRAFFELADKVNVNSKEKLSVGDVALGFIRVANEAMCRPIRALTQAKGYDTSRHVLACFGGAGGQHACEIARELGMKTVFIHRYAGILSAYGIALADVVHEAQEPCHCQYEESNFKLLDKRLDELTKACAEELRRQGFEDSQIETETFLHLRYEGTDCALMCRGLTDSKEVSGAPSTSTNHGDFRTTFLDRYRREFGFTIPRREIVVDDVRVRGVGRSGAAVEIEAMPRKKPLQPIAKTPVTFDGASSGQRGAVELDTEVFLYSDLRRGDFFTGPAIVILDTCTVLVSPGCSAVVTRTGDLRIDVGDAARRRVGPQLDAIQLSIFSHRFMSIAEQMGRVLQRTAISTNIKERLDFSCAVFGPEGGLVANAPHIPVHLGAMQETVQYQIRSLGDDLKEGDVILSNHPCAGGSHLPDLTVITPVFYRPPGAKASLPKPVFFVAARGHHADIGGITPGSMPPHSKTIFEEGAVFKSFKLVRGGVFQEEAVTERLMAPANYPGCSGSRNLTDCLSDLRAQVASNKKGIGLVTELIDVYGLDVVQAYMNFIQENAELAVRELLKEVASKAPSFSSDSGTTVLTASDFMDEGAEIRLRVEIDGVDGSAVFDFTGTSPEQGGNTNAPRAVTLSATIYCLRCMVGYDVPLNQGCLNPVKIIIPKGSLLDPSDSAAVVGGNVLTSQRIVDVIFKAFEVCAASQGCMNNITFGDTEVGYYETVAGGAGAGPTWRGHSGIHTHMTNTRITDPEIVERRYPVVLERFHLRSRTGGDGQNPGGDGVVREMLFRRPLTLSVLTERRVLAPYGLKGGTSGAKGRNTLVLADGSVRDLGAKASADVGPGDAFVLETPGGGGWGEPGTKIEDISANLEQGSFKAFEAGGSVFRFQMMQESA